jgi:hypothetical protein
MAGGELTYEFTGFTTTGPPDYRVDGYDQAIRDGTQLAAAKVAVLALLPSDTKTTSFRVAHGASGSCALWNVRSKTLGRWFAGKKVGDPKGDLGIVLDTVDSSGNIAFARRNVTHASVGLAPASKGDSC